VKCADVFVDVAAEMQETNVLGFKGPRKMTVLIPGMNLDHERIELKPRTVRNKCFEQCLSRNYVLIGCSDSFSPLGRCWPLQNCFTVYCHCDVSNN